VESGTRVVKRASGLSVDAEELGLELELVGFLLELDAFAALELEMAGKLELEMVGILELDVLAAPELETASVLELEVSVVLELDSFRELDDESLPFGLVLLSLQAVKRAKEIGRRMRIVFMFSNLYKLIYKD